MLKKVNHLLKLNQKINLKIFRFTPKMPQLMTLADLVIGKAGPNLLFETVALRKPFFAICHVSGQEDANLDLIRKKNLGFVEERPLKAIKLLKQIIAKPKMLDKFTASIEKEKAYNKKAGQKLVKIVKN